MIAIKRLTEATIDIGIAVRYLELMSQLTKVDHVTHEQVMDYLRCTEEKGIWVFGLFDGDFLIATLSLHFMFHLWGIEARIQNVITDAPHREKGYGTALLDYAIKVLPEIYPIGRECLGIYKETLAARPNAEGFYEKRGFSLDEQEYKRLIHPAMFIGS